MSSEQRTLSVAERIDWLRLIRSENVGPVTFQRLIERYGSAGRALDALPELAKRGGSRRPIQVCPKPNAERELEALDRIGAQMVAACEPGFPPALRALDGAPPVLSVRGNLHLLPRNAVGIVGARNASASGRKIAWTIARDLGAANLNIVSGLARGIDTAAHDGSLASGTVAVLAGGVDIVYPPENQKLYEAIVAQGAVVSEMPPGTVPQASHFPRRNRIISGISLGVVVIEASLKSGSLITARLAAEQGREVFAVPGSPLDPRCQGPNNLIREGATLTESAEDVLRALSDMLRRPLGERQGDLFRDTQPPVDDREVEKGRPQVLQALSPCPVTVDEIIRQCQLSAAVVSVILLELELAGRLERHPGSQVSLL